MSIVVLAGLAAFVVSVYVVVVLGGGAVLGDRQSPDPVLSVLATAIVALAMEPVQARLERAASRRRGGGVPVPYDVLSRFSEAVTAGYVPEELPTRMSRVLAEGTGVRWAQVWLIVHGQLTLAATYPADADADADAEPPVPEVAAMSSAPVGRRTQVVRHGGQVYGVFRLQEHPGVPLTTVEERLFAGLAAQAGLVLRLVALRAELAARHRELGLRTRELRASRERLIAAQDAERRRLERDLHDGAQQHLVALAVNLRLAQTVAARAPERAARLLHEQGDATRVAIETLSQLSRGIYPRLLADEGLVPALRAGVATSAVPVTIEGDACGRADPVVEAALYFVAMEAVQNAAKHSGAACTWVRFSCSDHQWRLTVTDDGSGFDQAAMSEGTRRGNGLANMKDRLDAVGGTVAVACEPGGGTTVLAQVPRAAVADVLRKRIPVPRLVP